MPADRRTQLVVRLTCALVPLAVFVASLALPTWDGGELWGVWTGWWTSLEALDTFRTRLFEPLEEPYYLHHPRHGDW